MKNTIKFFGIVALAAVIGFSFSSCGSSGNGGSARYMAEFFDVSQSNFNLVMMGMSLDNDVDDLIDISVRAKAEAVHAALRSHAIGEPQGAEGLTLSQIRENLIEEGVGSPYLEQVVNALASRGFVIAGRDNGDGIYGIAAAIRQ